MSDNPYPEEEFEQVRTLVRRKAAKRYGWDPLRDTYRDWLERELKQRGIWQQTVDSSDSSRGIALVAALDPMANEVRSGMALKILETRAEAQNPSPELS